MKTDPLLSIGAVAQRTGTTVSAIRFYADEKLIPSVRASNRHRFFPRSVIRRVSFILIAQNLGYTLKDIAGVLKSLPDSRTPTKADWDKLSRTFRKDIDSRIQQLTDLREKLSGCIGCGCLSLKSCQLYNRDDCIADKGAGARFLKGDKPAVSVKDA